MFAGAEEQEVNVVTTILRFLQNTSCAFLIPEAVVRIVFTVGDEDDDRTFFLVHMLRGLNFLRRTEDTIPEPRLPLTMPAVGMVVVARQPTEALEGFFDRIAVRSTAVPADNPVDDVFEDIVVAVGRVDGADVLNVFRTVAIGHDIDLLIGVERDSKRHETLYQRTGCAFLVFVFERAGHVHDQDHFSNDARRDAFLLKEEANRIGRLVEVQVDRGGCSCSFQVSLLKTSSD